jgi:hypothetical protein
MNRRRKSNDGAIRSEIVHVMEPVAAAENKAIRSGLEKKLRDVLNPTLAILALFAPSLTSIRPVAPSGTMTVGGVSRRARGGLSALAAMLLGLLAFALAVPAASAQGRAGGPPVPRPTMDVPNYRFEHEDARITNWRNDGPRTNGSRSIRYRFAYLILDPGQDGLQRRALVLVDDYKNPKTAFFLEGAKLLPIPEMQGQPLRARIDWGLTYSATFIHLNGTVTATIAQDTGAAEQVKLRFDRACQPSRKSSTEPV